MLANIKQIVEELAGGVCLGDDAKDRVALGANALNFVANLRGFSVSASHIVRTHVRYLDDEVRQER
jgi:hypothetical protein